MKRCHSGKRAAPVVENSKSVVHAAVKEHSTELYSPRKKRRLDLDKLTAECQELDSRDMKGYDRPEQVSVPNPVTPSPNTHKGRIVWLRDWSRGISRMFPPVS
jgi:hypothetical protein